MGLYRQYFQYNSHNSYIGQYFENISQNIGRQFFFFFELSFPLLSVTSFFLKQYVELPKTMLELSKPLFFTKTQVICKILVDYHMKASSLLNRNTPKGTKGVQHRSMILIITFQVGLPIMSC